LLIAVCWANFCLRPGFDWPNKIFTGMKKTKTILPKVMLFFVFLILNSTFIIHNCFSQPTITWQRIYAGHTIRDDILYSVCNADNGNFYAVGSTLATTRYAIFVLKLNPMGDTIWTRIIGGYGESQYALASVSLNNGNLILTGGNDTAFALKLDVNGNVVWDKRYPVNLQFQYTDLYDIINTSDNGFLLCGKFGYSQACFYKIDSLGNLQWYRIDSGPYFRQYKKLAEISNGYLIAGQIYYSATDPRTYLTKLDQGGNTVWEREYKVNNYGAQPSSIIINNQEFLFFVTAYSLIENRGINCILKLDTSGIAHDTVFVYSTSPPLNWDDIIQNAIKINANKFLITSIRPAIEAQDTSFAEVKIIDSLGNVIVLRTYKVLVQSEFLHGEIAQNGGYIFSGFIYPTDTYSDGFVVKTDSMLYASPIGIQKISNNVPSAYVLYQNYPNPFNTETQVKFDLKEKSFVYLKIYDINGKLISVLQNKELTAGTYLISWDGLNYPSGVYFLSLENKKNFIKAIKLILLK
jgi:hypothetical protein